MKQFRRAVYAYKTLQSRTNRMYWIGRTGLCVLDSSPLTFMLSTQGVYRCSGSTSGSGFLFGFRGRGLKASSAASRSWDQGSLTLRGDIRSNREREELAAAIGKREWSAYDAFERFGESMADARESVVQFELRDFCPMCWRDTKRKLDCRRALVMKRMNAFIQFPFWVLLWVTRSTLHSDYLPPQHFMADAVLAQHPPAGMIHPNQTRTFHPHLLYPSQSRRSETICLETKASH